jgi:hypothetical protein
MISSAALLVIYVAVNAAHLRIFRETNANPYVVWTALLGSLAFFGILIYYELTQSILTLAVFAAVLCLCFAVEWTYRKKSGRTLKKRAQTKGKL